MPPEADFSTTLILLGTCAGLLVLLLLLCLGLRSRLARIERLLAAAREEAPAEAPVESRAVEGTPGGPFEEFLNEDPARRLLAKKEQSAAYRKWRQERGMNWSNS